MYLNKAFRYLSLSLALCLCVSGFTACSSSQEGNEPPASGTPSQGADTAAWRPDGSVDWIVPSTAGGGHDVAARALAQCIEQTTGVKCNIVNKGEGGGAVALAEVTLAEPDGMTIGQAATQLVADRHTNDAVTYSQDSYRIVCNMSSQGSFLCVNAKGPFAGMTLEQFLAHAKENPVKIAVSGSWGISDHVRWLLEKETGIEFVRVSIKGGANCLLAVIAGDVDACLCMGTEAAENVKAGTIVAYAQSNTEREACLPDVPTFQELGYNGIVFPNFRVLLLPAETPDNIYEGWCDIIRQTFEDPATATALSNVGVDLVPYVGQEATDFVNRWASDIFQPFVDEKAFDETF